MPSSVASRAATVAAAFPIRPGPGRRGRRGPGFSRSRRGRRCRLAHHFGRRRFLLTGVALFVTSSGISAAAPSLGVMVGGCVMAFNVFGEVRVTINQFV